MKNIILVIAILLVGINQILAQTASLFSYEQFVSNSGDTLPFRQYYPDANPNKKLPLVIFLHGSGERGSDNEAQLKWSIGSWTTADFSAQYPIFIVAPQCPTNQTWQSANFTEDRKMPYSMLATPSKPMAALLQLIEKLKRTLPIDTNRIYITGLSMGGYGAIEAMMYRPNLFAAAIPVCGAGDSSKVGLIKHIPQWYVHGVDDAAVPVHHSVNLVNALLKAGAKPGFTMLPEVGHFAWHQAYSDKNIITWLFRQRKNY